MNCPVCQVDLLMTDRNGIEIDYCPKCRGIWLDRGELDKIIEKNQVSDRDHRHGPEGYRDHKPYGYKDREYEYKKHKKESFLGDLFDF
jgi:Zn-finger nucleic acid-binding protein